MKNTIKKVIIGVVMGSMILSFGSLASASTATPIQKNINDTNKNSPAAKHGATMEEIKAKLDTLVKSKTITEDQENKVLDYMKQKKADRKAEKEKLRSMSDADRKAYFDKKMAEGKPDFLKELVDSKVISDNQAKAIKEVLPAPKFRIKQPKYETIKPQLDTLVKSGKLTQAQEDKVISYMKQKYEERKIEMDKVRSMSEADRKAYFDKKKAEGKPGLLKELTNEKIISEEQANYIKDVMPKKDHKKMRQ